MDNINKNNRKKIVNENLPEFKEISENELSKDELKKIAGGDVCWSLWHTCEGENNTCSRAGYVMM